MEFDIDKQENFTCFPLVTMLGSRAKINFKKPTYLDQNIEVHTQIEKVGKVTFDLAGTLKEDNFSKDYNIQIIIKDLMLLN